MSGVMGKLKLLDAYPKVNEDFFTKTIGGGVITIVSSIIMVMLFLSEFGKQFIPHIYRCCPLTFKEKWPIAGRYLRPNSVHELSVDTSRGETIMIEARCLEDLA